MRLACHAFLYLLAVVLAATSARAGVTFSVKLDPAAASEPVCGRVVVSLVAENAKLRGGGGASPLDAPFWDDPQPMFGADVYDLKPGAAAALDDSADYSDMNLAALKPGKYSAAARLIAVHLTSSWRNDPGNLFGETVAFTVEEGKEAVIVLSLKEKTTAPALPKADGVDWFTVPSKLLSEFHGREVMLKAGVVLPADYDPAKKYAAVYWITGFGGDQRDAVRFARRWRTAPADSPDGQLGRAAFFIALDPESPNGHTLFADSDNNGPCGQALVSELIPALESKYPLIARPEARLLRGHSSGGWSSIWLALNYPQTFGEAWSSSPDPIDLTRFQLVDIYRVPNMYADESITPPRDFPSYRRGGRELMTIRQENGGERVLGANQTSAQQWHSWQAVAAPRIGDRGWGKGHPAALYDSLTGKIDPAVAAAFKRYDIAELLRAHPENYGPILRDRVRIVVGDKDNFYLNEAVALLKKQAAELGFDKARITIVPGLDHGSILGSAEIRAFPREMVQHLQEAEIIPQPAQ